MGPVVTESQKQEAYLDKLFQVRAWTGSDSSEGKMAETLVRKQAAQVDEDDDEVGRKTNVGMAAPEVSSDFLSRPFLVPPTFFLGTELMLSLLGSSRTTTGDLEVGLFLPRGGEANGVGTAMRGRYRTKMRGK